MSGLPRSCHALVTGGGRGIGRAIAAALAQAGATVTVLGRNRATLDEAVAAGCAHFAGLADVADGFGGGATREKKLEIMRDSRLGSYGAIALALALMLRVASLAALTERGLGLAISALICAGAVSRTAGLLPLLLSVPARRDGAGAAMPRPAGDATRLALILAGAASVPLLFAGLSVSQVLCAGIAAALAAFVVTRLAERQIGGYTGDVLGATQQAAEIAVLLALSAR